VRVLLVDDNPAFRSVAGAMVATAGGFELVGEVGSGEEAVTAARLLDADLVVMDIRLPGIDGVESTRRILADGPGRAVVLMSAQALDDHLSAEALSCGARGFLHKEDFDAAALRAILAG